MPTLTNGLCEITGLADALTEPMEIRARLLSVALQHLRNLGSENSAFSRSAIPPPVDDDELFYTWNNEVIGDRPTPEAFLIDNVHLSESKSRYHIERGLTSSASDTA